MQTDAQISAYISKITAMVATMPLDRVREVYDFTEFVNERIAASARDADAKFDDLLLADEGQRALHDLFNLLGPALSMFDESGKWLVDNSVAFPLHTSADRHTCAP